MIDRELDCVERAGASASAAVTSLAWLSNDEQDISLLSLHVLHTCSVTSTLSKYMLSNRESTRIQNVDTNAALRHTIHMGICEPVYVYSLSGRYPYRVRLSPPTVLQHSVRNSKVAALHHGPGHGARAIRVTPMVINMCRDCCVCNTFQSYAFHKLSLRMPMASSVNASFSAQCVQ